MGKNHMYHCHFKKALKNKESNIDTVQRVRIVEDGSGSTTSRKSVHTHKHINRSTFRKAWSHTHKHINLIESLSEKLTSEKG